MRLHFVLVILAFLLFGQKAVTKISYFPPNTLDENANSSRILEDFCSEQLRAMEEPSLWESSKNQKPQSYRFLWLRSFHHPISVRLDVQQDGSSLLTTKMSDAPGGYNPGKLVVNDTRRITADETTLALHQIERLDFWNLPSFEKAETVGPNGERITRKQLDGAQWIVEGVKGGAYHVVDRWSPKNGPVREIGIMMLEDLAKMELSAKEVY
jgi:hypothetical protein